MDANEFLKRVKPAAKRSRLAPFLDDINKLRGEGCTLDQVREFLAANGVEISVAGLSKYIKRQEGKAGTTAPPTTRPTAAPAQNLDVSKSGPVAAPVEPEPARPTVEASPEADGDGAANFSLKQRAEKRADQFMESASKKANPLFNRVKKEQDK